jgi:NADH dehydrogenase
MKRMTDPKTRILILGGGFAGVYAALRLQKRLGGKDDGEITLVSRENFFLFTPMLHEVAAGDLDPVDIVSPIRALLPLVNFVCGEVERIDLASKRVTVTHGYERHAHELPYDHLVLALGSVTNFFKLPGVAERALTMKSLGDAVHLRNRLISHLEEADAEHGDADEVRALLTVVVAGGGFAGIETIAGVNDFVRESLRFYPHLSEEMVRMVVVHPGEVVLPELGPDLGAYAQRKLVKRGIEVRTNVKVAAADDQGVRLTDGTVIPTRTVVWTAGTAPHPLVGMLPCACERGRIKVDQFLQVPKWPGVWAIGDCACVADIRNAGKSHPPTAQHAVREAKVAADNIVAAIRGEVKRPFDFALIGQLAAIGRRTGVAKVLGVKFSGFIAWWLWRTIYLAKLPRFEKKLRVAIDWTMDLLFPKDLVQYFGERAAGVSHEQHGDMHAEMHATAVADPSQLTAAA